MEIPKYHNRDYYSNTNVMQAHVEITDVSTIADRVKQARKYRNLTQAQLAKAAGVSQGAIGNLESGTREKPRELLNLALALGVNINWLANEKGPMLLGESNIAPTPIGSRSIALIDYVQAGAWAAATSGGIAAEASDWLLTDLALSDGAFALEIKGDSMLPDFQPGDRVIIDPAVEPHPGDFVVAKNGEHEATFKKYRPRGVNAQGKPVVELVPLNHDHPSLRSDTSPFVIIGTMVEHRKYRKYRPPY